VNLYNNFTTRIVCDKMKIRGFMKAGLFHKLAVKIYILTGGSYVK